MILSSIAHKTWLNRCMTIIKGSFSFLEAENVNFSHAALQEMRIEFPRATFWRKPRKTSYFQMIASAIWYNVFHICWVVLPFYREQIHKDLSDHFRKCCNPKFQKWKNTKNWSRFHVKTEKSYGFIPDSPWGTSITIKKVSFVFLGLHQTFQKRGIKVLVSHFCWMVAMETATVMKISIFGVYFKLFKDVHRRQKLTTDFFQTFWIDYFGCDYLNFEKKI